MNYNFKTQIFKITPCINKRLEDERKNIDFVSQI